MPTVKVPSTLPEGVINTAESNPLDIDNGHLAASRVVRPLENALYHLAAGLEMSMGGFGSSYSSAGNITLAGKLSCPPFGGSLECCVWVGVNGGAYTDTVTIQLTTENDGTGESRVVPHLSNASIGSGTYIILRATLGDGTKTAAELDLDYTLTLTRSGGSTSTTYVHGVGFRLVPQEEITL